MEIANFELNSRTYEIRPCTCAVRDEAPNAITAWPLDGYEWECSNLNHFRGRRELRTWRNQMDRSRRSIPYPIL